MSKSRTPAVPPPESTSQEPSAQLSSSHSSTATALEGEKASARENKTIRLRVAFEARIKGEAYRRTIAEGRRVTESDIIDEALEAYFRSLDESAGPTGQP